MYTYSQMIQHTHVFFVVGSSCAPKVLKVWMGLELVDGPDYKGTEDLQESQQSSGKTMVGFVVFLTGVSAIESCVFSMLSM